MNHGIGDIRMVDIDRLGDGYRVLIMFVHNHKIHMELIRGILIVDLVLMICEILYLKDNSIDYYFYLMKNR
jgi:hypothetical protein